MSLITKALRVCYTSKQPAIATALSFNKIKSSFHTNPFRYKPVQLKMAEKTLPKIFKYVDENVESYKSLLKDAVAIPSVSCDPKYREECVKMVYWMRDKLKEVGASTEIRDVGYQNFDGKEVKLPPVLVGVLENVSKKPLDF